MIKNKTSKKPSQKIIKETYIAKNNVVVIKNLKKSFKTKIRSTGFKGFFKSIINPEYKAINAINDISFSVNEGELVAFIGPNGAGKSTTLKILSGILYPDSGEVSVLSLNPQKDRKKLAYSIGTVFGQKPQLWFHLPPMESFNLFAKIYEIPDEVYKTRINYLIKRFEIEDIIDQPARKLSLGQRMRCEIVLSLIHNPKILFLDEPTIGLDIIAKKNIRELIREINENEHMTIILTSHDMDDVEKICKRAVIINKGIIVYDGKINDLKNNHIKKKTIKILSETKIVFKAQKNIKILKKSEYGIKLEINTSKVKIKDIINQLLKDNQIIDLVIEEPEIEEIIESVYKK
ncbi:MAG: ABC transporter ATP-binding protein [Candidatus Woesearchaeota archaeon]